MIRISTPVRVIPVINQSNSEAIITGTIVQVRIRRITRMKSAMSHVVSATEGLNGVLSGKI